MAKLAVILFLFSLCAVATSNPFFRFISRTDNSTLFNGNMQIEIQGETEKVNEFLKAVDEGRASLQEPYHGVRILTKISPWCATV